MSSPGGDTCTKSCHVSGCRQLGAHLRGRTATQRSKKGSERVLGKGSQKGSQKGSCYGFYRKKGSEKGSQKRVRRP